MHEEGVSVVIPTLDRWDRLQRSLAMVLHQRDCGPMEVIVVDDGGTDGTAQRVEAIGDLRVRALRMPEPTGVSSARNAGLAAARHRWVAFNDDDDLWSLDKLGLQLAAVRHAGPGAWCAGAAVTVFDDWTVLRTDAPPASDEVAARALADNPIPGGGSGVLAATELVRRIGGFDPALSLLADWDLWTRLALEGTFVPVPELTLAYVRHDGAMSNRMAGSLRELDVIKVKYAGERACAHVGSFGVNVRRWMADGLAREGLRRPALELYLPLAVETRRWSLARPIVGAVVGPSLRARLNLGRRTSYLPAPEADPFVATLRRDLEAVLSA